MARILLVDDDPKVLRVVEIALQRLGHEIRKAGSLEQGMNAMTEFLPELVVADIMMPAGTEGFEFVHAVRAAADPQVRNVTIVLATAIHDFTSRSFNDETTGPVDTEGKPLPVQGWLDKPIDLDELFSKVSELTGQDQAA